MERSSFIQSFKTPDSLVKSINPQVLVVLVSRNVMRGNIPVSDTSSCGEKMVKLQLKNIRNFKIFHNTVYIYMMRFS